MSIILKLPVRTHLNHYHFKVHQIVNGNAPSYLSGYFIPINTNHTIRTRSSQTVMVNEMMVF